MPAQTALQSLAHRRFLLTGWPWRAAGYLLTTPPVALAAAVPLVLLGLPWLLVLRRLGGGPELSFGATVFALATGAVLLGGSGPLVAGPVAVLERRRLRLLDDRPTSSAHRPFVSGRQWIRDHYTAAATWRELAYAVLLATVVPVLYAAAALVVVLLAALLVAPFLARPGDPVALGFTEVTSSGQAMPYAVAGLLLLPGVPYLLALVAGLHGALARALLHDGDEPLREELVEVSQSRARLVDAFEAERRRIERDLHDGAQQRLVSLTLQLGMARMDLPEGSPAALAVSTAHTQAKDLLVELRELIHDIHPVVLTDLGVPAALRELAERCATPVTVHADVPHRHPRHVEATAYFVVAEALANAGKHSGARAIQVTAMEQGDALVVQVRDDGCGGADPRRGTGLTGLADRIAVVGGTLRLSSPPGGPTVVHATIPGAA